MEDSSIVKPILEALDYFNNSPEEINYFYKIIDKFCANWFNKNIQISKFKNIEYIIIHDLLGEYIRFEENNKRIALWLLAINRVCYNYTSDLKQTVEELNNIKNSIDQDIDSTLIEPILKHLKILERLHKNAGKDDTGQSDLISNFLQWVMIYTSLIYPSLENKMDFYEKSTVKAMNFLLIEFIKQRSNDKRIAYLLMAIMEACRDFSLQHQDIDSDFVEAYEKNNEVVLPGKEKAFVEEILNRLKNENIKQRENPLLYTEISPEEYVKDKLDKLIEEVNFDKSEAVNVFNKNTFEISSKFLSLNEEKQIQFLQTLFLYRQKCSDIIKPEIIQNIKRSVSLLSEKTKEWFRKEVDKLENQPDKYFKYAIKKINSEHSTSKYNSSKLFIMVYLFNKLSLLQ